ncbi:hypothetical protein [Caballeronia sp. SL2Y3]|uniref:hypothetical protein n=1 Tax=Caballeronia sp. SL2Y3 TaxID=2878151 RepID=UPI001FD27392|nr:hypothetical protein [Caballeronia sp. SL2Y3]
MRLLHSIRIAATVTAPNGRYALCADYRRLFVTHETIGYSVHEGPLTILRAPATDGIYRMNLATGKATLSCGPGSPACRSA